MRFPSNFQLSDPDNGEPIPLTEALERTLPHLLEKIRQSGNKESEGFYLVGPLSLHAELAEVGFEGRAGRLLAEFLKQAALVIDTGERDKTDHRRRVYMVRNTKHIAKTCPPTAQQRIAYRAWMTVERDDQLEALQKKVEELLEAGAAGVALDGAVAAEIVNLGEKLVEERDKAIRTANALKGEISKLGKELRATEKQLSNLRSARGTASGQDVLQRLNALASQPPQDSDTEQVTEEGTEGASDEPQ